MTKGFAVVGVGTWGQLHAQTYATHPGAKLIAVCDANEERATAVARQWGCKAYTGVADLVADSEVAAVTIATPDFAHAAPTLAALAAGKHVLVEKPLATTVAEAEEMVRAANRSGVTLMVDFHNRWNPLFYNIKKAITAGDMGRVAHLYIRHSNTTAIPRGMLSWSSQSSAAWFLGSHSVDLALWLTDAPVTRVYTVTRSQFLRQMGIDSPDFFLTTVEFEGGAVGLIENSWMLPESLPTAGNFVAEVVTTDGCAFVDFSMHRAVDIYHKKNVLPDILVKHEIFGKQAGFAVESIRHFADCVIGGRPPAVAPEEGLAVTRVIAAALESAARGEPVSLG